MAVMLVAFLLLLTTSTCSGDRVTRSLLGPEGVISKVRAGLNMAGKLLGLDKAQGVASLVSSSLLRTTPAQEPHQDGHGLFFRLLGLDSKKLGAIALNALIFIAQLISSAMTGQSKPLERRHPQKLSEESLMSWLLNSPNQQLADLVSRAQERSLPDQLISELRLSNAPCVQLLVCKAAPFIWGMQGALLSRKPSSPTHRLTDFLPTEQSVIEHGEDCEERLPNCGLFADNR